MTRSEQHGCVLYTSIPNDVQSLNAADEIFSDRPSNAATRNDVRPIALLQQYLVEVEAAYKQRWCAQNDLGTIIGPYSVAFYCQPAAHNGPCNYICDQNCGWPSVISMNIGWNQSLLRNSIHISCVRKTLVVNYCEWQSVQRSSRRGKISVFRLRAIRTLFTDD